MFVGRMNMTLSTIMAIRDHKCSIVSAHTLMVMAVKLDSNIMASSVSVSNDNSSQPNSRMGL